MKRRKCQNNFPHNVNLIEMPILKSIDVWRVKLTWNSILTIHVVIILLKNTRNIMYSQNFFKKWKVLKLFEDVIYATKYRNNSSPWNTLTHGEGVRNRKWTLPRYQNRVKWVKWRVCFLAFESMVIDNFVSIHPCHLSSIHCMQCSFDWKHTECKNNYCFNLLWR